MSKLYPCVYCTEDGYCKKYSDEEVTSWCVQGPCKDEKPSNADNIRAKSDDELAEWLERIRLCCTIGLCGKSCPLTEICYSNAKEPKGMFDWLKQEAKK